MKKERILLLALSISIALVLSGCPREELPSDDTPADIPAPIVPEAVDPPAHQTADQPPAKAAPIMSKRAVITGLALVPIEIEQAEDGHGNVVNAVAPMAIEISAEAWPVRALDPVLSVGDLVFRHYTFPRLNVLRYVVADHRTLPVDTEAVVQYGDDNASRVVVAEKLEVPQ